MLVEAGCRIFTIMRLKSDPSIELPVFFAAILNRNLRPDLLEALLPRGKPKQDELLYRLLYQGKNVLEVAVENELNADAFRILVDRCGARVIADRNAKCQTVRDFASECEKNIYVQIIDEYVELCVQVRNYERSLSRVTQSSIAEPCPAAVPATDFGLVRLRLRTNRVRRAAR